MTVKELKKNIELISETYDNVEIKDIWLFENKLTIEFEQIKFENKK